MILIALAAGAMTLPDGPALTDAIAKRDTEFFHVFFDVCDPPKLRTMLTDDFEMYHDKDGVVTRSADPIVTGYGQRCAQWTKPDQWRSRRELVAASLKVWPIPGFGAIEEGDHIFYERKGNGPERKAGVAHFVQTWALTPEGWKLSRVLSYAHRAAE